MPTIDRMPNPAPIAPPMSIMHETNPTQAAATNTMAATLRRLNFLKSVFTVINSLSTTLTL